MEYWNTMVNFLQNLNFELDIVDNIVRLPDYTNKNNNVLLKNG